MAEMVDGMEGRSMGDFILEIKQKKFKANGLLIYKVLSISMRPQSLAFIYLLPSK